jgi:hypothetical protein
MAEPKPIATYPNRRLQRRYTVAADSASQLSFQYPRVAGTAFAVPVRDISLSGLSFRLPEPLPGITAGDILAGVEAVVVGRTFRGDMLVMHLTPGNEAGAICGGLFYPETDEDLITIRLVVRSLDASPAA